MKIRNRQSYFTTVPEVPTPRQRRISVSRTVYLLCLAGLALYLLWLAGKAILFVSARGYVNIEGDRWIEAGGSGRIAAVLVQPEERVTAGQPLLAIDAAADRQPSPAMIRDRLRTRRDLDAAKSALAAARETSRQLTRLRTDQLTDGHDLPIVLPTELRRARDEYLQRQARLVANEELQRLLATDEKVGRRRIFELARVTADDARTSRQRQLAATIGADRRWLAAQQHRIALLLDEYRQQVAAEIRRLERDIAAYTEYLQRLESSEPQGTVSVVAPVDGRIIAVLVQPDTVVERGQPLLRLRPPTTQVRINAFFKLSHLERLQPGKRVRITFPDGTTGTGLVRAVYSTARTFPKPEYKDYMPIWVRANVEIEPVSEEEAARWRRYEQMDVKVRVRR